MMKSPGDDFYWGEFHCRFEKPIDRHILKTLHGDNMPRNDEFKTKLSEFKEEINHRLMVKFLTPHFFDKALVHPKHVAWLLTVVRNEALDWYGEYRQTANVTDDGGGGGIRSIDEPVGGEESDTRLGDTIAGLRAILPYHNDWKDYIDGLLQLVCEKEALLTDEKRLAFKIDLMFYRPLSEQDILEIAARRKVSPAIIKQEIALTMEELFDAYDVYERQQNLMKIRKDNIRRMECRLLEKWSNTNISKKEIEEQKKEIEKAAKLLTNLENRVSKRPIGPSVRQLSDLMNLDKAQERDVSIWLKRVKDALKSEMKKRNKKQN